MDTYPPLDAPRSPGDGILSKVVASKAKREAPHEVAALTAKRRAPVHRILVCLDSSPSALFVLEAAVDVAWRAGARLLLLRAVGLPAAIDQEAIVHAEVGLQELLVAKAKAELTALAEYVPHYLLEGLDVHVGTPWDTICREAKALECELVVMGSHPHSLMSRLLGTTAAKVANHCRCPVLFAQAPGSVAASQLATAA